MRHATHIAVAALACFFAGGCFSIQHSATVRHDGCEEHIFVSNYGWYLFNLVPLVCGNASHDPVLPFVFFRDDVTMDKIQRRFMDEAFALGKTQIEDLHYINDDSILFEMPGFNFPIPVPYLLTFKEIKLSGDAR